MGDRKVAQTEEELHAEDVTQRQLAEDREQQQRAEQRRRIAEWRRSRAEEEERSMTQQRAREEEQARELKEQQRRHQLELREVTEVYRSRKKAEQSREREQQTEKIIAGRRGFSQDDRRRIAQRNAEHFKRRLPPQGPPRTASPSTMKCRAYDHVE